MLKIISNKIYAFDEKPLLYNGHYEHDNKLFISKELIFDYMCQENTYNKNIKFNFHDNYFNNLNWAEEPPFSLEKLYRQRANSLREEYEYLILSFSGGTDSTEILYTFLDNGIFLDEVQIVHFSSLIKNLDKTYLKKEGLDIFTEYDDCALEHLKEIKKRSPHTKIVDIDATDFFLDDIVSGKFSVFNPKYKKIATSRYPLVRTSRSITAVKYEHNQKYINPNKKTAMITGIEKPMVEIENGKFYFNFNDMVYASVRLVNTHILEKKCVFEEFYWSKKSPLIPIKQAHIIKKVLENDKEIYDAFKLWKSKSVEDKLIVKGLMYDKKSIDRLFSPYIYKYSTPKSIQYRREWKKSADIIASEIFFGKTDIQDAILEYNKGVRKKYPNIPTKYLKLPIDTRKYCIGKFNPKFGV
jgi:hypothetical protein